MPFSSLSSIKDAGEERSSEGGGIRIPAATVPQGGRDVNSTCILMTPRQEPRWEAKAIQPYRVLNKPVGPQRESRFKEGRSNTAPRLLEKGGPGEPMRPTTSQDKA